MLSLYRHNLPGQKNSNRCMRFVKLPDPFYSVGTVLTDRFKALVLTDSTHPVIGQSSSVIEDQNTHIATTENSVNNVSKNAPSIWPLLGLQI